MHFYKKNLMNLSLHKTNRILSGRVRVTLMKIGSLLKYIIKFYWREITTVLLILDVLLPPVTG